MYYFYYLYVYISIFARGEWLPRRLIAVYVCHYDIYIYIYIHTHTYTFIYIYIYIYTYNTGSLSLYIYIYIYTYTYVYICIYIYIYIVHSITAIRPTYYHCYVYIYIYIYMLAENMIPISLHSFVCIRSNCQGRPLQQRDARTFLTLGMFYTLRTLALRLALWDAGCNVARCVLC